MVENKYYERKIKYLDLMENGERTGGAGFIKSEVRGMEISLAVTVKGLHPTDTYERDVVLRAGDGEFAVGRIALKAGQGQFKYHTVMDYSQLQGIRIVLGGTREICCKWQEEKRSSETGNIMMQENTEQADAAINDTIDREDGMKQHKSKKSKEIQLIPWDEIKAVEESLERVEKLMSKPKENTEKYKTTERMTETTEKMTETTEKMAETTEKMAETTEKMAETAEKMTEATEKMAGSTEKMPEITEKMKKTAARVSENERETAKSAMSANHMGLNRTAESAAGHMANQFTMKKPPKREMAAGQAARGRRTGETTGISTMTRGRKTDMENTASEKNTEHRTEKMVQRQISGGTPEREKRPIRLMEDKWQQIWAIYPHIHPFQDEREYLSISPADFVLLPDEAYRAANNSFLLHGYYNYDHLILTKIERRGEVSYYIGVPGNYYEREKQVAIMFGFESFECGTEPAQAGDFGYYMMKTQL